MPYATAQEYLDRFGATEAVQLLADEDRLLTRALLADAMAGTWTGAPTAEEQVAAEAALQRLEAALTTASNVMDGYLLAAYTLPLAASDADAATLRECCLVLARLILADDPDNRTDQAAEDGKTWRAWLSSVAIGKVKLVGQDGQAAVGATRRVRSGQARSGIDWAAFGGGV